MSEIRTTILENYANISTKQKIVADYVLEHGDETSKMTMKELAVACDVAEPTIVRFLNKLGYDNFLNFRVDLAKNNNTQDIGNVGDGYKEISEKDSTADLIHKTADAIVLCLKKTESIIDQTRIDTIAKYIVKADELVFYGAGNSASIAMDAGFRFYRMGVNASFSENLHITLTKISRMTKKDVLILISHSGESRDTLDCAEAAKKKGAIVVGITGNLSSPLAKSSDYVFFTSSKDLAVYSDAMVSRMAQMMILDMVYLKTRFILGDDAKDSIKEARDTIVNVKIHEKE